MDWSENWICCDSMTVSEMEEEKIVGKTELSSFGDWTHVCTALPALDLRPSIFFIVFTPPEASTFAKLTMMQMNKNGDSQPRRQAGQD